ncbi:MAG: SDR family NAD(P)-dependent oxidoreductase, partial [Erysipelotrichaceae bacterium]|nr:SDR family NAD(P)-dependent oxidoreductase [Erysipelotrichaceae bacterium]
MRIGIITGASSGMGKAFALALDKEGLDELWLIARRKELLEEVAKELTTSCKVIPMDLSDKDNIQPLSKELEGHEVRWLVNSAGVGKSGSFESLSLEDISSLIDINIKALTLMSSMCLPYCSENSKIVNLSSSAAFLPQPNFAVYAASK